MHAPEPVFPQESAARFGVCVDGLQVLLPAGCLLEFLPRTRAWQLPLAPAGVLGLMQWRGHSLPVFQATKSLSLQARRDPPVLVIGGPPDGAALVVDSAPMRVSLQAPEHREGDHLVGDVLSPASRFACPQALGEPLPDLSGVLWWPLDPARLFAELAGGGVGEVLEQ